MRRAIAISISISISILILATGTAWAAGPASPSTNLSTQNDSQTKIMPEISALQVSPMYLEIKGVLENYDRTEKALLRDLAGAKDELEVKLISIQIKNMDLERDLDILNIQARYAHQEQRWALEEQIRHRIRKLEEGQLLAAH